MSTVRVSQTFRIAVAHQYRPLAIVAVHGGLDVYFIYSLKRQRRWSNALNGRTIKLEPRVQRLSVAMYLVLLSLRVSAA